MSVYRGSPGWERVAAAERTALLVREAGILLRIIVQERRAIWAIVGTLAYTDAVWERDKRLRTMQRKAVHRLLRRLDFDADQQVTVANNW